MNDGTERALCLACLESNTPNAHFCRKCGAPLSSYATTAPLEHIYALGWMYRTALSKPARPIVLLGVWLILGPTFLWTVFAVGWTAYFWAVSEVAWPGRDDWMSTILWLSWAGISGLILWRITKTYVVDRMCHGKD